MRIDTRPNLSNDYFEQFSGDTLTLSGTTQIVKDFKILSGGTFHLIDGNEQKEAILTSNESGLASWKQNNFPIGLEGNTYFIDNDNTRSTEPDFTVRNAVVVENDEEFNEMTGISFSFKEVFDTWYMFSHIMRQESYFDQYYRGNTNTRTPDSIIGEGTTATVTLRRHGFKTGKEVTISGADQSEYNGTFSITVTGFDTFTYTANSSITTSPATGLLSVTITYVDYDELPPMSPPRFPAADPLGEYSSPTVEQVLDNDGLWGYDESVDGIYCTTNWGIVTGFVSINRYDSYVLEVDASSTAFDDDIIGVVIGFDIDSETGFEYSLSVYRSYQPKHASNGAYRIQFNFGQNSQRLPEYSASTSQLVLDGSNLVSQSGQNWSEIGKTKFYIKREDDVFTVMIGQQGSNSYDTGTTLSFDLKDYSFLRRFRGPSKIGFLSFSQPDSYFTNLQFTGFGDYIFYNKNTYHDTWEYNYDTSKWFHQYPQTTTLHEYVGVGRIINSERFGKIYYTRHDGLIKKLADGGGTGNTVNITANPPLNVIDGVVQFDYQSGNTYLGDYALINVSGGTGSNNVALGYNALHNNINGNNNIALGYNAGSGETGSNKIYIGYGDSSGNTLIYGDSSTKTLKINGSLSIVDGTQLDEGILTSDEYGNASWKQNNFPIGLEGNTYFINKDNTRSTEPDFTVKNAIVVETDKEFNTATGDTYTFEEIFNTWTLFSHFYPKSTYTSIDPTNYSPTNFPALDPNNIYHPLTQEDFDNGDFWRYETTTDSILLNQNYNPYTGYISDKYYDYYNLETRLSSTATDDDLMAVIIAFYTDPDTGFEYTLSAVRQPGGLDAVSIPRWGIVYNYNQNRTGSSYNTNPLYTGSSEQIIVGTSVSGDNINRENWNTNGDTKISVIRSGDTIIVKTCAFTTGTPVIDDGTTITINLADYDVLEKFRGPSRVGFAAQSQQDASFSELQFSGFGNYIFYNKENHHDTWEYNYDTLTWSLQNPQVLTLHEYIGVGRIVNSDKFGKLYYTKHSGIIEKLAAGGSSGSTSTGGDSMLITQSSHGFAVKDVIGFSGGTYNKAIANSTYDGEILGLVTEVLDSDTFRLTQAGYVDGLSGLYANTTYFLSDSTYGLLTSIEPTANNSISKTVLIAETSSSAWVLPYVGYYITSGSTYGDLEPYEELASGSTVTWDASTGLNKELTIGSDFSLILISLLNGMSGDLRLNITNTTSITLPPCYLNGNVTSLSAGVYHLAFVYNGNHIDFNIARYNEAGISIGYVPDVNTGTAGLITSTSMTIIDNTLVSSGDDVVTEYGTIYTQYLSGGDFSKDDFSVSCVSNGGTPVTGFWDDTIFGLIEGNTYYYKAYAINSFGIDEGDMKSAIPTAQTLNTYRIDVNLVWNDTRSDSDDGLDGSVKLMSSGGILIEEEVIPDLVSGEVPKNYIIQWTGNTGSSYDVNLASINAIINNSSLLANIYWRIGTGDWVNSETISISTDSLIDVMVDGGSPQFIVT